MLGQLLCCRLQIHLVIQAHVSLALCPNRPWCMCHYMRLQIAFRDNQQISLADSTPNNLIRLAPTWDSGLWWNNSRRVGGWRRPDRDPTKSGTPRSGGWWWPATATHGPMTVPSTGTRASWPDWSFSPTSRIPHCTCAPLPQKPGTMNIHGLAGVFQ